MTTDSLTEILNEVREHYLNGLQKAANEFKRKYIPAAGELLVEINRDAAYPFRLYRIDMAANVEGNAEMEECNLSERLNFSPRSFTPYDGLSLRLSPVAWNGVEIMIDTGQSLERLEQWTLRWLDVDDTHEHDERGFQSVIHSVTAPTTADGWTTFSIDFGSAPLSAVEELLQMLVEIGATQVVMKSDWVE